MREALAHEPTLGSIEAGRDAYLTRGQLRALTATGAKYWSFHGVPTTVALPGNTYAKSRDRFTDHLHDDEAFRELLREYEALGVPRPGGYADVFHKRFKSPHVPYSVNVSLLRYLAGGWQSALKLGVSRGTFYKYDMRSAYLWAGSLGMPDPRTYRRSTVIDPDVDGLYAVELCEPTEGAPFPFNRARRALATSFEIETYGLKVRRVISGVRWTRTMDPTEMLDAIRLVSTWKQAGRSYWGRWGQSERLMCHAGGNSWTLPNPYANAPWAALIIARVKMRLWSYSTDAVHVYVDSVITPHVLPTGTGLGDWKLEHVYRKGVIVRAPGQYGDPRETVLQRMAGVPKGSKLRTLATDERR